jgi:cell shape-determining protein MreC
MQVDIYSLIAGIIAVLAAVSPIVRKYLKKFSEIISLVAAMLGNLIALEQYQKQFLEEIAEALDKPEELVLKKETLKQLLKYKHKAFEEFEENLKKLMDLL